MDKELLGAIQGWQGTLMELGATYISNRIRKANTPEDIRTTLVEIGTELGVDSQLVDRISADYKRYIEPFAMEVGFKLRSEEEQVEVGDE